MALTYRLYNDWGRQFNRLKTVESLWAVNDIRLDIGLDAEGDIFYRGADNLVKRLGIGSADQVLSVVAGLPSWVTLPPAVDTNFANTNLTQTANRIFAGAGYNYTFNNLGDWTFNLNTNKNFLVYNAADIYLETSVGGAYGYLDQGGSYAELFNQLGNSSTMISGSNAASYSRILLRAFLSGTYAKSEIFISSELDGGIQINPQDGKLYFYNIANDNTEDKLLTWNSVDRRVEYRTVSSLGIPTGANYIENQSAVFQTATYKITGPGTIGGTLNLVTGTIAKTSFRYSNDIEYAKLETDFNTGWYRLVSLNSYHIEILASGNLYVTAPKTLIGSYTDFGSYKLQVTGETLFQGVTTLGAPGSISFGGIISLVSPNTNALSSYGILFNNSNSGIGYITISAENANAYGVPERALLYKAKHHVFYNNNNSLSLVLENPVNPVYVNAKVLINAASAGVDDATTMLVLDTPYGTSELILKGRADGFKMRFVASEGQVPFMRHYGGFYLYDHNLSQVGLFTISNRVAIGTTTFTQVGTTFENSTGSSYFINDVRISSTTAPTIDGTVFPLLVTSSGSGAELRLKLGYYGSTIGSSRVAVINVDYLGAGTAPLVLQNYTNSRTGVGYFDPGIPQLVNFTLEVRGTFGVHDLPNATIDTDRFLVQDASNGNQIRYRTGAEVLSDIGAAPSSGSGSYIQNQVAAAQVAGYRIDGNGYFDGGTLFIRTSGAVGSQIFASTDGGYTGQLVIQGYNGFVNFNISNPQTGTIRLWYGGSNALRLAHTSTYAEIGTDFTAVPLVIQDGGTTRPVLIGTTTAITNAKLVVNGQIHQSSGTGLKHIIYESGDDAQGFGAGAFNAGNNFEFWLRSAGGSTGSYSWITQRNDNSGWVERMKMHFSSGYTYLTFTDTTQNYIFLGASSSGNYIFLRKDDTANRSMKIFGSGDNLYLATGGNIYHGGVIYFGSFWDVNGNSVWNMVVDNVNNRVGIGLTAPSTKLHVVGRTTIADTDPLVKTVINGNAFYQQVAYGGGYNLVISTEYSFHPFFRIGYKSGLTDPTGLTYDNIIAYGGNGLEIITYSGNGTRFYAASSELLNIGYSTKITANPNQYNYDFHVLGSTDANLFYIQASTNRIGIGTSTPGSSTAGSYKLDVNGVANFREGVDVAVTKKLRFKFNDIWPDGMTMYLSVTPEAFINLESIPRLRFVISGTNTLTVDSGFIRIMSGSIAYTVNISGSVGNSDGYGFYVLQGSSSAAAPTYSFYGNQNTGIYSGGFESNIIHFSANGVKRASITATGSYFFPINGVGVEIRSGGGGGGSDRMFAIWNESFDVTNPALNVNWSGLAVRNNIVAQLGHIQVVSDNTASLIVGTTANFTITNIPDGTHPTGTYGRRYAVHFTAYDEWIFSCNISGSNVPIFGFKESIARTAYLDATFMVGAKGNVANNYQFQVYSGQSYFGGEVLINIADAGDYKLQVGGNIHTTGFIEIAEQTAPATPASGFGRLYPKSDGKLYWLSDGATEYDLTASGGSTALSALTAATATNTIDNGNYAQTWKWDSLTSSHGLILSTISTARSGNSSLLSLDSSGTNATGGITAYGLYANVTNGGTSSSNTAIHARTANGLNNNTGIWAYVNGSTGSTNRGGLFEASVSGGTTNIGIQASANGGTNNYAALFTAGRVGIGTSSPSELLHVVGTLLLGTAGATLGVLKMAGNTSGVVTIQSAAAAGTWTWTIPVDDGEANQFLLTNGSGVTSWKYPNTLPYRVVTTNNYNIVEGDAVLDVDNDANNWTIILPDPSTCTGKYYTIKRLDSTSTGTLTVDSAAGNVQSPQDGTYAATIDLPQWQASNCAAGPGATWQSNGTNWVLISTIGSTTAC